jgi:5'-nucleotidase
MGLNVLVVNDDGIHSEGLRQLVEALSSVSNVYVCAPDSQRSGASQSLTLTDKVFVDEVEYPCAQKALVVTGTPTDCTKIGLQFFGEQGVEFDLLYSGVNVGSNLGCDTLYSGTVGAAMEGALSEVRSIALSVEALDATDFTVACEIAVDVIPFVMEELTPETVLNINVPYLPREEIRGVRTCSLGGRYYIDAFVKQSNGGYVLEGYPKPEPDGRMQLDMSALAEGYVTITPMHCDYTQSSMLDKVSRSGLKIRI